jgi:hypothetical protein
VGSLTGEPGTSDPRIDASGDRVASIADLLPVVNALRNQKSGSGSGEGEFVPLAPAAQAPNAVAPRAAEAEASPTANQSRRLPAESEWPGAIIAAHSPEIGGGILALAVPELIGDLEEALSAFADDVALEFSNA